MNNLRERLNAVDWENVTNTLNEKGYVILPKIISDNTCNELIKNYDQPDKYRKTVVMERYRFGLGEYKYFNYPLPETVQTIRESIYPRLVRTANNWMHILKIEKTFPSTLNKLIESCHANGQLKPTPLILKYGKGGFNTLHQDLYGEIYFPFQSVLFLNEPEDDYTGGEFVMSQQTPRTQSKAIVLRPKKADLLIFTTNFRPIKGKKGYFRANMKHGVSELNTGKRYTLGIIFHDAIS